MRTNSRITLVLTACGLLGALAWFRPWMSHEPPPQSGALSDKPAEADTARPAVRLPVANHPLPTAKEPQAIAANIPAVAVNAHLRDYEASDNLAQLVASLEDDVRSGDTRAAWVVASALNECAQRNLIPSLRLSEKERADIPVENRESTLRHLAKLEQRCSHFALDRKTIDERQLAARAAALEGNDAISQATKLAESPDSLRPDEAKDLLRRIAQSRDPWAIWAMADAVGVGATEHGYEGPYAGDVLPSQAWKFVACRLGYPCGPDSTEVRKLCAVLGRCISEGYEGVMRHYYMSPAEFISATAMRDQLLGLIAAGDYHAIFP